MRRGNVLSLTKGDWRTTLSPNKCLSKRQGVRRDKPRVRHDQIGGNPMSVIRVSSLLRHVLLGAAIAAIPFSADAQEKHYRFAYDQPNTTGYGVAGDTFANKMSINIPARSSARSRRCCNC
jgi:hypothetical protein